MKATTNQTKYPEPPFPEQQKIEVPGTEKEMNPKADHGESSYQGTGKLKGKVAVITGADSGIGKAVAIAYAREGADIVICHGYESEMEDALDTAKWVKEAGRKSVIIHTDIREEEGCQKIIDTTILEFGRIDILVNNAAFQMSHNTIEEIPSEDFRRTFETNVFGMFYLCKAAAPHLQPGSSIINTASINSYDPSGILLDYAASKGAIQNFTANLAQMFLKDEKGIRVNAVAPGPVWTPLIPSTMPEPQKFGENYPMKRPAQPAELAPSYVFLASDESGYISGATIAVTGGKVAY